MSDVKLITTGGTIDKDYNPITGVLGFTNTHVRDMLDQSRCTLDVAFTVMSPIDSLQMTTAERLYLVKICEDSPEDKIVITHGTDTMIQTAEYLAYITNKTIVLTGSLVPLSCCDSDGAFNLASALAYSQTLPVGIYIAMNGKSYPWDMVKKNKETGIFEPI